MLNTVAHYYVRFIANMIGLSARCLDDCYFDTKNDIKTNRYIPCYFGPMGFGKIQVFSGKSFCNYIHKEKEVALNFAYYFLYS